MTQIITKYTVFEECLDETHGACPEYEGEFQEIVCACRCHEVV